jgi:hypothetical protein
VIGNDGWESSATDIIGVHDYDSNGERLGQRYGNKAGAEELFDRRRPGGRVLTLDGYPHRGQPIMLTEFGGVAYTPPESGEAPKNWGYFVVHSEDELAERYKELLGGVANAPLLSGYCYTQFADTFQEANGLLYADRTPKIPLAVIREATSTSREQFLP